MRKHVPEGRPVRLPLAFAQQRVWFLSQLAGGVEAYNVPRFVRLKGRLDREALARALGRIVQRHETLRTVFPDVDGSPVRRVLDADEAVFPLRCHDLRGRSDPEAELRRLLEEDVVAPFDLRGEPQLRAQLARVSDQEHALLLGLHHVSFDSWSVHLLVRELNALYGAFVRGEPDPLPPVLHGYGDYVAWQHRRAEEEGFRAQVEYWRGTLAGAPGVLALPTDRPRPGTQDFAGGWAPVELPDGLTRALEALARRHDTTLFTVVLAAWAVVLGRLARQEDVVLGVVTANRDRPEFRDVMGYFVNTLPVRLDLSGAPAVGELLARVRDRQLAARAHQDVPFERMVEVARPERVPGYAPLVQALVTWRNASEGVLELPGVDPAPIERLDHSPAKCDVALRMTREGDRVTGGLEYAAGLFEAATVKRWGGYLRRVLESMAADDSRRISELELLCAAERHSVVQEWNRTEGEYPRETCVHELFERRAAEGPGSAAVCSGEGLLTRAELNARANRLAHHLRALGVGPDARVAVCLERSAETLVALLAVLKAGGAYVPLDPAYPADRLRSLLADCAPVALLTGAALEGLFSRTGVPVLRMDADAPAWSQCPASNPDRGALSPDHLAYVVYTSGSTGRPKGVMVAHRSLANLVAWHERAFGPGSGQGSSAVAGAGFDASTWEVWPPLCSGGTLHLAPGGADPQALQAWWAAQPLEVSFLPTPLAESAFAQGVLNPTLRLLLVGGDRLHAVPPGLPFAVVNNYGPTETTVVATSGKAEPGGVPSIGRPILNTRVYLLDPPGRPVPVGVAGELHVAGAGVARGYLGRPGMTAERFVPDPFSPRPGERMYRTGDLCRWLPAGTIRFEGRSDFQVKVRGFRIEPGEIEAALLSAAGVREAVVAARTDAAGETRLVAYVVPSGPVEVDTLRDHLSRRLPEPMVPAAFVRMDALPLTPNGKVDRTALPAPEEDAFGCRPYEAPVGEVETALAGIWTEVLGVERVGRGDDFFALGGHSLRAVRMAARAREALSAEVTVGDVFAHPVLSELARTLVRGRAEPTPVTPAARDGDPPLSFAQQRLCFLEQVGEGGVAYHVPWRLRLAGPLDRAALRRALDRMVARHEVLRTRFPEVAGEPVQRIAPAAESAFALGEHDLAGRADAEPELARIVAEEAAAPFRLERGPLVRGRLVRMREDEHVLLVTLHHAVADGWSMDVLARELGALYAAFRAGGDDPLPPLPVQYADYAVWQRARAAAGELEAQAAYWQRTLAGAPERLDLPTDRPRPPRGVRAGAWLPLELDAALTAEVKALSRRHGTTLFATLLAAWSVVLSRASGQAEVVVGTPVANRAGRELEGLVGFFVNTLALRVDLSGSPTAGELLERVRARTREALRHPDVPFEQVVERVRPARTLSHAPLFQVMLAWEEGAGAVPQLPGIEVSLLRHPAEGPAAAKFDLSLTLSEREGRIAGGLEYATEIFDRATVERHAGCLRRVLEEMAADESRPVDRIPLLPAPERRRVVEEWGRTEGEAPPHLFLHAAFEAWAARAPGAVALVGDAGETSYGELNARANRLAHHLRALGAGPDARVALCLERGPAMVAGLLAVLKAGGAYVPLDPSHPEHRVRDILRDCAPVAVVTQESLAGRFAAGGVPVLRVDADDSRWSGEPAADPAPGALCPDHLAYVIYTSGSTGRPKGVGISHAAACRQVGAVSSLFCLGPHDRGLQFASAAFDVSVEEIFGALSSGAALVLRTDAWLEGPSTFWARCEAHRVSVVDLPTRFWQMLARERAVPVPPCVRLVVIGGEAVEAEALEAWFRREGHRPRLLNAYGPTETAVNATIHEPRAGSAAWRAIGRPVPGTRVLVLDRQGEPVPPGVAGEIHVGGPQLARGYWNLPRLTAQAFVPDSVGAEPGARLYRTGDLGRWTSNGVLEFLGRTDHQVKVRGFRIEPGEIEARLLEHPAVREAVVVPRQHLPGDLRLVAYLVGGPGSDALREHLRATLPAPMIPAAFVFLDALPLTASGKLDRSALPAPEFAGAEDAYVAPRTPVEEALAALWAEVLGVERVGVRDSFFALGGHSLLATRLAWRMREALEGEAGVADLFQSPTIEQLAPRFSGPRVAHAAAAPAFGATPEHLLGMVDRLSEEELDRLLASMPATDPA